MTHQPPPAARPGRPWWRRGVVLGLIVALAGGVLPTVAGAQSSEDAAERAAREIQGARERANAAAEAYFAAESELDLLELELVNLQTEESQLQLTVDRLRSQVEAVAVSRFVSSGTTGIPLLTEVSAPQAQVQTDVLVDVVTNAGTDVLDQFDAAEKELRQTQDEVATQRLAIEQQKERFAELEQQALAEVERLREIEEERLKDEAVRKALEAQQAAERARLEEEARREAEAAARALPNPGLDLPIPTTTEVPPDADPTDSDGADADGADADATDETTPDTTTPVSTLPTDQGASGGTSGGRTGVSGGGSNPVGITTGAGYIDNVSCPILGSAYADTWGAPRSGGRRHQGVDMIAPSGVPLYAVTSGVVTFKQNRLGGNAVSLVGDNGNRYYYAHLSAYEGASGRRVVAGEVIGYNGSTGNSSTPHLHLQIHPGGGQPVNPYPTMRAMGC